MAIVVSPFFPFPNIAWWKTAASAGCVVLDSAEHFQKMGYRNRYRIAAANGPLLLSIPLEGGRSQRLPMKEVNILNGDDWKTQHWRSLFSAYGRSPFFEHYGPGLEEIFNSDNRSLIDFNRRSIEWLMKELRLKIELKETIKFEPVYVDAIVDFRKAQPDETAAMPRYTQVFENRYGFVPNLSALDLLMNEGPAAGRMVVSLLS